MKSAVFKIWSLVFCAAFLLVIPFSIAQAATETGASSSAAPTREDTLPKVVISAVQATRATGTPLVGTYIVKNTESITVADIY
jgi:hypothetical protein